MKPKYHFQVICPRARKFKENFGREAYKIKDVQSTQVMHNLKMVGYKIEGNVETQNNSTYGMVFGSEHIVVTDSGKYPFFIGDTVIRIGTMTQFYQAPIYLR